MKETITLEQTDRLNKAWAERLKILDNIKDLRIEMCKFPTNTVGYKLRLSQIMIAQSQGNLIWFQTLVDIFEDEFKAPWHSKPPDYITECHLENGMIFKPYDVKNLAKGKLNEKQYY